MRHPGETRFTQIAGTTKAVTQFLQAQDGTNWIADGWAGIRPLLAAHPKTSSIPLKGAANLTFDAQGDLWFANNYTGLLLAQHPADSAIPINVEAFTRDDGLTSNETRGLLQDRERNIWVDTGLNYARNIRFSVTVDGTHPIIEDELYFNGRKVLSLCCRDNGRGIAPEVLRNGGRDGHWGLRGMRERARKTGAKLDCATAPGGGTEVTLTVSTDGPLSPSARN